MPNKEKKVTEVVEKVDFKPSVLLIAAAAMGVTAYALHFIKNVGWTSGFAFRSFCRIHNMDNTQLQKRKRWQELLPLYLSLLW